LKRARIFARKLPEVKELGNPSLSFEVAVVGGGLVGAALARALDGARVALIAQSRREPSPPPYGFDARIYAISPGNAAFLTEIGAWGAMPQERVTPVHGMRVHGDDAESLIEFDAADAGVEALAWIIEDGLLQDALWEGLARQRGMELYAPAECAGIEAGNEWTHVKLTDGRALRAKLVVGADGARSAVRAQAGIAAAERSYGQTAVVANFACARPHRNLALQWFQGAGRGGAVLALLPLPGAHVSMVWSVADAEAGRLLALESGELARAVEAASHGALGELAPLAPARAFPLRRLNARRLIAPRVALIGDAGHVVHPLAGQGANLGFQDARELARVLRAREAFRDPGEPRLLRRFERARAEAILAMRATVHGLFLLFEAEGGIASRVRNAGLNLADRMPVIKNILMRHAMR
jgi:ubiquinone biosynthesis UbiH/UbiF/VisC/COQ6 family hydroxylase